MKTKLLSIITALIFTGTFSQTVDTLSSEDTRVAVKAYPEPYSSQDKYKESATFKAYFMNANVYRSREDIPAMIVGMEGSNAVYRDSVVLKIDDETKRFDYKIINEDLNGLVIIKILPCVKFVKESKVKKVSMEIYKVAKNDEGQNILIKDKMVRDEKYDVFSVEFADKAECASLNDENNPSNYYFAVKKEALKPQAKILFSSRVLGIPLVHPFKYRPKTREVGDELSGTFTLSYNFGIRVKLRNKDAFRQNYISFVPFGFGFGAEKYFKKNSDGTTTANDKKDAIAITYYQGGLIFTFQKVNLGFFYGFDKMIGDKKDWLYQDRVWYSFGIGYKLGDY